MDHAQAGLATLFGSGTLTGLSDIELLERFASRDDRVALEVLVGRHATLVLNVCRSLLSDPNDADDAFQATFLVLARKAGSIRAGDSIASWLCRVAYRIAVRAGTESTRRRQVECRAAQRNAGRTASEHAVRPGIDEIAILFDELDRLPERYRTPVVLCHLEGLSTDAAAKRLSCPVGTLWARLSRARAQLRSRLVRRGVSMSVGALAAGPFPPTTQAAISSELLKTLVRTAMRSLAIDGLAAGATSARAHAWTDAALKAMVHAKLKTVAMILLTVGAIATVGAGVFARAERRVQQGPGPAARQIPPEGRTIHFPDDRALGILYIQDAEQLDRSPVDRTDSRRRIGEARGVVRLPARGLVELDLSKAAVVDLSPLDQLAPDAIQSLRFDHLAARDDSLRHVEHLKGLKEIILSGNFITNEGLKRLAGLEQLESISLGDSLIGDEGIRHIAGLPRIRSLGLYRSRITDEALRSVGTMKGLVSLDLGVTAITDRGMTYLKDLTTLGWLRFSSTNTTDASLAVVGGLTELQSLDFDSTRATDAGLAHLVGLKRLKAFRAFNNVFTDAGLAHLAQLPALEDLIASYGSRFTDAGLAHLGRVKTLRHLSLNGGKFSDAGLSHLAQLPHLEDLWLSSSSGAITRRSMLSLSRIPTLKRLELSGCSLGGAGLAALSQSPSLESLILGDESLTFDDLAQLEKFRKLKDLRFFRMATNPGRPTLRHFRNLKSLTWLELPYKPEPHGPRGGIDFEPAEFAYLSGLTRLEHLEYTGRITDEGLEHLAPLTAMTDLRLRNPQLTDEGLKSLSGMKHLEFLVIGGRITDEGVRHLEALTSLRFLSLETRTVSVEAIRDLRSKLPTLHTVLPFDQINELYRGQKMTDTKTGEKAPDFKVTTRQGAVFRLDDHRGKVVLVHFWGPKCAPCLRALSGLKELAERRSDRFAMIGLTVDMEDKAWRESLDRQGIDWPQALLGGENLKVWDAFHVLGIPDYAVIDTNGKIIADGASTGRDIDKLKAAIVEALGKR